MKDYFFCYSKNVCDFLNTKGFRYITIAMDMKTQKVFSLFEISPELNLAMSEYKSAKK